MAKKRPFDFSFKTLKGVVKASRKATPATSDTRGLSLHDVDLAIRKGMSGSTKPTKRPVIERARRAARRPPAPLMSKAHAKQAALMAQLSEAEVKRIRQKAEAKRLRKKK